jgi:hypothetical protein
MARIVLFVPTAKTEAGRPSPWLERRLNRAAEYYHTHRSNVAGTVVSGRWSDCVSTFDETEASIARRYLLQKQPGMPVELEQFAVETGGNFAFSKPIIARLRPDEVVVFNSDVYGHRAKYFARQLFEPNWHVSFELVRDELAKNARAVQKEPKALAMYRSLFDRLDRGDDAAARRVLLEETPFYDRRQVDNEAFFNARWPGGFSDYKVKRLSIDNQ